MKKEKGKFDKDKWYWNDTKRINEQEKRVTWLLSQYIQLTAESKEHKKAIISLIEKVKILQGQSRWDDVDPGEDCKTVHVPSCPKSHHWVKEDFHED